MTCSPRVPLIMASFLMPLIALATTMVWIGFVQTITCQSQSLIYVSAILSSTIFWSIITIASIILNSSFSAMAIASVVLGCGLVLLAFGVAAWCYGFSISLKYCEATLVMSILSMNGIAGIVSAIIYGLLNVIELVVDGNHRGNGYAVIWQQPKDNQIETYTFPNEVPIENLQQ